MSHWLRYATSDSTRARSTAAVQGFGKVGRGAARFLAADGVRVVAASDEHGAVWNPDGLDVPALEAHVDLVGTVAGFTDATAIDNDTLLALDVDLLVPAAVEGVLHADNASAVRRAVVVEGANGPTTTEADRILQERGVLVVPDILANAGGVVVSYFEWVQANQAYWWTESEVQTRLAERMTAAWQQVLHESDLHEPCRSARRRPASPFDESLRPTAKGGSTRDPQLSSSIGSRGNDSPVWNYARVKRGMAEMLKGGVIMDVVTPEQARSPRTPARSP